MTSATTAEVVAGTRATRGLSVYDALVRALQLTPHAEAVVGPDVRLTYEQVQARCRHLVGGLRQLGADEGSRVAVIGANSVDYFVAYFAIPGSGMVLVPLNTRLQRAELVAQVSDCRPTVILADDAHRDEAIALGKECGAVVVAFDELASGPESDVVGARSSEDLAAIFYTGGTSGRAKGVMLTHGNLGSNSLHMIAGLGYGPTDTYLHCAPMFHLGDGMSLFPMTWVGGRHVVIPRFEVDAVIDAIERERVTCVFVVPTMLGLLLERLEARTAKPDLSSLRLVVHGGAPIAPPLLERAIGLLGCSFTQSYGMTEAGPILSFLTREEDRVDHESLRSAGQPVVGVEVRVVRPDGSECLPGEVGEIVARGPNIARGYWNQPDVTDERFRDGWYWSGDLAHRDAAYHLYIVGRAGDVIISGGENIYAAEVEAALAEHPDVLEVAVFGMPSDTWGETVHASVVLRRGAKTAEDELDSHCRALIAGYKVPRAYQLHGTLPRTGAGKIDKRTLRERYWAGHDRDVS